MKTLFVCAEGKINDHVDEEYDYILEVDDMPTTESIAALFNRVRDRIRALWMEDTEGGVERGVSVNLDGPSPYNAMLIDLEIVLREEEKIVLNLSYLDSALRTTNDIEAQQVIDKLDNR